MSVGVLAIQGAFAEHIERLHRLGVKAIQVKTAADLVKCSALIIPGGESTTMATLLQGSPLWDALKQFALVHPVWGTCAGLILLAKEATHTKLGGQPLLACLDVAVCRNGYGSQIDSFETHLNSRVLGAQSFPAVFIRAPIITKIGSSVQVLMELPLDASPVLQGQKSESGVPVAVRQGHLLATSFHPELTQDTRLHEYFMSMVQEHLLSK